MGTSRTTPTKLAIAPIFGSPKAFTSAERSKSSRCTEIFTSPSGDRRKERNFIPRPDGRGRLDHVLVHGGCYAPRFRERLGPSAAARAQVRSQGRDRGHARR